MLHTTAHLHHPSCCPPPSNSHTHAHTHTHACSCPCSCPPGAFTTYTLPPTSYMQFMQTCLNQTHFSGQTHHITQTRGNLARRTGAFHPSRGRPSGQAGLLCIRNMPVDQPRRMIAMIKGQCRCHGTTNAMQYSPQTFSLLASEQRSEQTLDATTGHNAARTCTGPQGTTRTVCARCTATVSTV